MSAKRARKPPTESSANTPPPKRQKILAPEAFVPLHRPAQEHESKTRVPEDTELTPIPFFSLYWGDSILQQIVQSTNIYAQMKRKTVPPQAANVRLRRWKPLNMVDLKRFISTAIFMGITRLPSRRLYWLFRQKMLPKGSPSFERFSQIKRYLHLLLDLQRKHWWQKLEPLSSHLRARSQALYRPSTHISIDEKAVMFTGRRTHTVRVPSNPIPCGYKVPEICNNGYTLDWMHASRVDPFAGLKKHPDLSPTDSAILQLCRVLDTRLRYIVNINNAFTTVPLLRILRERGIGGCGTARTNAAGPPVSLEHDTNAATVRRAFEGGDHKSPHMPTTAVDHHMNGIDVADQCRAAYTAHHPTRRNWMCLFFFLLDVSLINAHLLFKLAQTEVFIGGIDTRDIRFDQTAIHKLEQHPPDRFRREIAEHLLLPDPQAKNPTPRLHTKKAARIYLSKRLRAEWSRAMNAKPVAVTPVTNEVHHLEAMQKRRECIICRLDFREGKRGGRQRPKVTSSECTICSPPAALCGPEGSACFIRWHSWVRNQE